MAEIRRIDAALSPHHADSELARINRDAGRTPVALSAEMATLLARAEDLARLTDGAFDITCAALGRLYDNGRKKRPGAAAVEHARAAVGWRKLELDAHAGTVRFATPGMCIDLGGVAKGHAVDNAAAILQRLGIRHASVAAGGHSRVLGDRRGQPWTIGIRDPRRSARVVAMLPLEDVSVSTSGDCERCFDERGERFHPPIDPATGKSPSGVHSVTVLGAEGLVTAALSKAVFVQGVDKGLALIEAQRNVDAVIVDAAGQLHHSAGFFAPSSRPKR
jgi:thiamine biosynthesis lipoprotein